MPHNYQLEKSPHMPLENVEPLALHINSLIFEDMARDQKIVDLIWHAMVGVFGEKEARKYYDGEVTDLEKEAVFSDQYDQIETALLGRILLHLATMYMEHTQP